MHPSSLRIGRNDLCSCNSGKKYKRCCGSSTQEIAPSHHQLIQKASLLVENQQLQQAEALCKTVLAQDPTYSDAYFVLGMIHYHTQNFSTAEILLKQAIDWVQKAAPGYHYHLGVVYEAMQRFEEAMLCYHNCLRMDPYHLLALRQLGHLHMQSPSPEKAIPFFKKILEIDPGYNQGEIAHRFAALTKQKMASAPLGYVTELFNHYAESFDHHLTKLGYHIPQKTAELLLPHLKHSSPLLLDLGCGTGLAVEALSNMHLSPVATGVDVSEKMLEKAQLKKAYTMLHHQNIESFIQKAPSQGFEVILAEDVFIYIGALETLFSECHRLLMSNGLFAFSIETTDEHENEEYLLRPSARFAHSPAYIERLRKLYGFEECASHSLVVRQEWHQQILGKIYILQKP